MTDDTKSAGKRFGFLALSLMLFLGFAAGGLAVAGAAAWQFHHMGWSGHHRMGRHMDQGEHQEHMKRMVGMLAWKVDATPEQKQKLGTIAAAAAKELEPMRDRFAAAHRQAHDLLLQPTLDRAALEALRAQQIANADEASRKMVGFLADAAEVLTPEQRAKLAKDWDF